MKMYILIKEDVPLGLAITAASHASLAMWLKFGARDETIRWQTGPFRKVICKVNEKEFENAKKIEDHVVLTESALDDQEVAIAFAPREEWPKMFKFLRLYK
jgi:peptidyl-tRNA hydrolase